MSKRNPILFVALGILLVSAVASAVPLLPGNSVGINGTNLPGDVKEDDNLSVTVGPCTFNLRDRVTENPDGTYNFNHHFELLSNDWAANGYFVSIVSFAESGFMGYSTDVDWDPTTNNGVISPFAASRDASGDVIIFDNYDPAIIGLNEQTDFTTTQTDALAYALVGTSTITIQMMLPTGGPDEIFSGTIDTFAPIPEPATLTLLVLGGLLLRRKK